MLNPGVFAQQSGASQEPLYETVVRDYRGLWSEKSSQTQTVPITSSKSLTEVANLLPGATAIESVGNPSSIFLWGAESSKSLVLLDGIPISDGSSPSGGFDFDLISSRAIKEFQWMTPAESIPWGSGALGGLLWITSGQSSSENGAIGVSTSTDQISEGHFDFHFGQNWKTQSWASIKQILGYSSASESRGNSEKDPTHLLNFGVSTVKKSESSITQLHLSHQQKNESYDGYTTLPVDDPNAQASHQQWQASISHTHYSNDWETRFQIIEKRIARSTSDDIDSTSSNYLFAEYSNELTEMRNQNLYKINSVWTLDFGGELQRESVSVASLSNAGNERVQQTEGRQGVFVRTLIQLDHFKIVPGFRQEWQGSQPEHISAIRIEKDWARNSSLELSVTSGVRAPSMYQLYSSLYGNGHLKSEKVIFSLLTYSHKIENGEWRLDYFDQNYSDLITTDATLKYQNIDRAFIRGWDSKIKKEIGATDIQMSWTEFDAKDGNGNRLPRRPRYQVGASLVKKINSNWNFNLDTFYKSDRLDGTTTLKPYQIWSTGINFENQAYQLQMMLKNIFDAEYEDILGYQSPRRAFYLTLSQSF